MTRTVKDHLHDMLEHMAIAEDFVQGMTFDEFANDLTGLPSSEIKFMTTKQSPRILCDRMNTTPVELAVLCRRWKIAELGIF